ncbi:hypothetical protein ScPMuIL_007019 [Solemya velum]
MSRPHKQRGDCARVSYNGGRWPYSSPSAGVYDITNTSTKLLLLNNRSRRRENRLRGQNDQSLEDEDRFMDPYRHSRVNSPVNRINHAECFNSTQPYFKPSLKTGLDWTDITHRPGSQYSEPSTVNPKRHTSCGVPTPSLAFEPGVETPRKNRPISVRSLPTPFRANPLLVHPDLSPGEKKYLYSIAQLYNVGPLRRMKHKQYTDILFKEMDRGVYTEEEINRKLQRPQLKPDKVPGYKKSNSMSSSSLSSISSSGADTDRKLSSRQEAKIYRKPENVPQQTDKKPKDVTKGYGTPVTKLVGPEERAVREPQEKTVAVTAKPTENEEDIKTGTPITAADGNSKGNSVDETEKKEEKQFRQEDEELRNTTKISDTPSSVSLKSSSTAHTRMQDDQSEQSQTLLGKENAAESSESVKVDSTGKIEDREDGSQRTYSDSDRNELSSNGGDVPTGQFSEVKMDDTGPIPVDRTEGSDTDTSSSSDSSTQNRRMAELSPHREGLDRPKSRLGHRQAKESGVQPKQQEPMDEQAVVSDNTGQPETSSEAVVVETNTGQPVTSSEAVVMETNTDQPETSSEAVVVETNTGQPETSSEAVVVETNTGQPETSSEAVVVETNTGQPETSSEAVVVETNTGQPETSSEADAMETKLAASELDGSDEKEKDVPSQAIISDQFPKEGRKMSLQFLKKMKRNVSDRETELSTPAGTESSTLLTLESEGKDDVTSSPPQPLSESSKTEADMQDVSSVSRNEEDADEQRRNRDIDAIEY